MANVKISQLPDAGALDGTEELPIVQGGTTKRLSVDELLAHMTAADLLALLLTVDGAGSGLDADLLDGLSSAAFVRTADVALVRKTADETVNNSNTLQDDDALTFTIDPGTAWVGEVALFYVGDTAADIKFALSSADAESLIYSGIGPRATDTVAVSGGNSGVVATSSGTSLIFGANTNGQFVIIRFAVVAHAVNPTAVTVRWAQNTTTAADTILKAGSHLSARKVT